jgi:hypothetical protein
MDKVDIFDTAGEVVQRPLWALGTVWIRNRIRMFYNEIKIDQKGKHRGWVTVQVLDSSGTFGIFLRKYRVHPDDIADLADADARKEKYGY